MVPVVVVGAHTVGLGVVRALSVLKVPIIAVYYDRKDMGIVSNRLAERVLAPHPELHEERFIGVLLDLARRVGKSLLIPASDASLATISRRKDELERGYMVACADWAITELCIDKKRTYALADAIGVPAPCTLVPRSVEEAEAYGKTIQYPCLLKPSQSHQYFEVFRRKMIRVESLDGMVAAYREAADLGLEVLMQEIIPGEATEGANYNSYFWEGAPLAEFTARKIRNAPSEFGSPCVVRSEPIPQIVEPGRRILGHMGYYGYSCTEFKRDPRDGVYKLMEINGRHNLSTLLAVRCGVNFPEIQYRHLVLGESPRPPEHEPGIYWIDLTRDMFNHAVNGLRSKSGWRGFSDPYRSRHVFAILDSRDLRPFAKRCAELAKEAMEPRRG